MKGKTSLLKRADFWIYILLILISLAVAIYTQLPALKSRYVINDDVRQHTYWMDRFHDKELFKDDIYAQYSSYLSPYGFKFLYYLLTLMFDPILAGKLLSIALYALCGVFLFKIGKLMQDRFVGLILFSLFILFPVHIERFAGGLHRAFAYPLLIIFLYYLFQFKIKECAIILILQILFYPVIFFVCYPSLILTLLLCLNKAKRIFSLKGNILIVLLPLAVLAFFLSIRLLGRPDFLGELISKQQMLNNPSFYAGGRTPLLPLENVISIVKRKLLHHKFLIFFAPLFFLSFLSDVLKKQGVSKYKIILALFISGALLYHLAGVFLCRLFIPERYLHYSLPLVSILIIAIGMGLFFRIEKVFFFIIFITLAYFSYGKSIRPGIGCTVNQTKNAPLFEYLSTLSKDTVIAANPYLSDDIACFSRRKTFLKMELSEPWFTGYAGTVNKRILAFFQAYYSDSGKDIYDFCKGRGIEFLVVRLGDFSKKHLSKKRFYLQPLNEEIIRTVQTKKMFFLPQIDEDKILFRTEGYFVIEANRDTLLH